MQDITVVFIFSVLLMRYYFFILVNLSWNLVPKNIQISKIHFCFFHFYRFLPEITFLTNLFQKAEILYLSQNLVPKRIRILTMMMFTFFVLDWKNPFWSILGSKIQNCLFKVKFGTETNSNMRFWPEITFLGKFKPKNEFYTKSNG